MAAKLYYGGGQCSIEGTEIRSVLLRYQGKVIIDQTANDSFFIAARNNGIMIAPIGEGYLTDLFTYQGEFKILSVGATNDTEKIPCSIKRVMDYTELQVGKVENMTTKTEDLKVTHKYQGKVNKTRVIQDALNNQNTSRHNGNLYTADGRSYNGSFHIMIETGQPMTGAVHNDNSEMLYVKKLKDSKHGL
tara:strand:+ start:280 stop:849 length:570 start_codon:yes stop_codon:yes gene_type:complete